MSQKSNWKEYYKRTISAPPRPTLIKALAYVQKKDSALDIGAGALNDSKYLLEQGFKRVIAIDSADQFVEVSESISDRRFFPEHISVQKYGFNLNAFDLINAGYSLPFIALEDFPIVLHKIHGSLVKGGIFCGQLFGNHDDWHTNTKMTFHNKEAVINLLSQYEIIEIIEEEKDASPVIGNKKHWHLFHFIVKK